MVRFSNRKKVSFSYSEALEIASRLFHNIDRRFHHGSLDGTVFIAPADRNQLNIFWEKNCRHLCHFSSEENKKQLSGLQTSDYNVYFFIVTIMIGMIFYMSTILL